MPKVSVIIPNYNHEQYLKQRIDSVLYQTYEDFEIIVLDDCSTDNSKEVIERYSNNEKIGNIIYNDTNSGSTFKQWDKGIQLARGEYIWIAESDDWCEPTLLENLVNGIEQNENCVLAYCQGYCVNDDNSIRFQSSYMHLASYVEGKKFIKEFIVPRNPIFNAGMAIWKKELYDKISKEFIEYKQIGDYLFWIEIATCGDVFICGKLLNYFRMHRGNVSAASLKNGTRFIYHIPLYKKLLERRLIDKQEYDLAMKKSYSQFRMAEKKLQPGKASEIKQLFAKHVNSMLGLKLYFYLKQVQYLSKKWLRV